MKPGGPRAEFRGETVEIEVEQRELPAADETALDDEIIDDDEDAWP